MVSRKTNKKPTTNKKRTSQSKPGKKTELLKTKSKVCELCKTPEKADTPKKCACNYKLNTIRPGKNGKHQYIVKEKVGNNAEFKRFWQKYNGDASKQIKKTNKTTRKVKSSSQTISLWKKIKQIHKKMLDVMVEDATIN